MKVIYRITCTENGKFYIGSTVNKTQRWARHRKDLRSGTHPNKHLLSSWQKYGEAAFTFEVIEEVADSVLLFAAEQKYLDEHAGKDYCFNWSRHADAPMRGKRGAETPNYGKTMPDSVRDKIRAKVSGSNNPCFGVRVPDGRREKIRQSNLAYPHKDRKHTAEAKAKIAAAGRGRVVSQETRDKRSAKLKGREIPLEQRIRISQTLSGEGNFWFGKKRPEHGEKVRKAVVATNPQGEKTLYESILALREHLGLKPSTVNRALKSEEVLVRGPYKGWHFRYAMT